MDYWFNASCGRRGAVAWVEARLDDVPGGGMRHIGLALAWLCLPWRVWAAGPVQWTWEAGRQTSNGSITVKSLSGGTTYSGTQNPTGAVAKTNQNAVTQPPTVIIQATGGAGGACLGTTRVTYAGNLGGLTGADAKCAADFGTGWRFATVWEMVSCIGMPATASAAPALWVHSPAGNNCSNWTSNDSGQSTYSGVRFGSGGYYGVLDFIGANCGQNYSLACVKIQ